jgi:hypothetical protein
MSKVQLQGNASGTGVFTIASPNSNTDRTLTLPNETGTILTSGGAIAGTTGTFSGIIQANGGGIQFPATAVPSADANTLDDYEEGTWTPQIRFGGNAVGVTYSNQKGNYVKIGSRVFISMYLELSNKGSSTGSATIIGLPFTSQNVTGQYNNAAIWVNTMSGITGSIQGYCGPNSTSINEMAYAGTGGQTIINQSNFGNNSDMMINFSYTAS